MTFQVRWSIGILVLLLAMAATYGFIPPPDFDEAFWQDREQSISEEGPIILRFSQAMNQASVERAFSITPSLPGEFIWKDRKTLQYTPRSKLVIGDRYRITVVASARSLWGKRFAASRTLDFVVMGPPFVEFVTPPSNPENPHTMAVDQMITVGFDRPMETEGDADDFLIINPPAEGELQWLSPQVFEFVPERWDYGAIYSFTVPAGLLAKNGGGTELEFTWTLRTPSLHVLDASFSSDPTEVEPLAPLKLTFNQEVDLNSVQPGKNVLLYPSNDVDAEKNPREDGFMNAEVTYGTNENGEKDKHVLVITPTFPYLASQAHRLVLKPDLKVLEGDSELAEDFELPFFVSAATEVLTQSPEPYRLVVYSDRAAYLPGDPLYFYGFYRRNGDRGWGIDESATLKAELQDSVGAPFLELQPAAGRSGFFYGKSQLPPDAPQGQYFLTAQLSAGEESAAAQQPIVIQDLQNPIPALQVLGQRSSYRADQPIDFHIQGSPLIQGRYRLTSTGEPVQPYRDDRVYSFGPWRVGEPRVIGEVANGDLKFNERGQATVKIDPKALRLGAGTRYVLELEAADERGQKHHQSFSFVVEAGEWAVGLAAQKYWLEADQDILFYVIAANSSGRLLPNKEVQLTLAAPLSGAADKTPLLKVTLDTQNEPERFLFHVPAEARGFYSLLAESEDDSGHAVTSEIQLFVAPPGSFSFPTLTLIPDQLEYLPGGKAHVRVLYPDGIGIKTALLTVGRAGVWKEETIDLTESHSIDLLVEEEMAPYIFVTLTAWDPTKKQQLKSTAKLNVSLREEEIQVQIQSEITQGEEGKQAVIRLKTQDYQQRPVSAQVVLQVGPHGVFQNPLDVFYGPRPLPLPSVESSPTPPGETIYFNPLIKTDEGGEVEIEVPLTADFEQAEIHAVAFKGLDRFGATRQKFQIQKSLELIPELPPFVRPGDALAVGLRVMNHQDHDLTTSIELIGESVEVAGVSKKSIFIPARSENRLEWKVTVLEGNKPTGTLLFRTPDTFVTREWVLDPPVDSPEEALGRYRKAALTQSTDSLALLWALSETGQYDTRAALEVWQKRSEVSLAARGLLLMLLDNLINAGQKSLRPLLEELKSEIASDVTEKEEEMDAVTRMALERVSPENPLLQSPTTSNRMDASHRPVLSRRYVPLEASPLDPSLKTGQLVRGELELIAPEPEDAFTLEEFLPAGLRLLALDPELANVSVKRELEKEASLQGITWPQNSITFFDHHEVRHDRILLSAFHLPAGVYRISFVAETTHAGQFQHPGARASSIFDPRAFAKTIDETVEIK